MKEGRITKEGFEVHAPRTTPLKRDKRIVYFVQVFSVFLQYHFHIHKYMQNLHSFDLHQVVFLSLQVICGNQ